MTNNKNNNGPEDAKNSSNETQRSILFPANNSYGQSLYIAALDRYLGIRGLISPVEDQDEGVTLAFDFFQPSGGKLVKIFRSHDIDEIKTYMPYSNTRRAIFIYDAAAGHSMISQCDDCDGPHLYLSLTAQSIAIAFGARVYHENVLWQRAYQHDQNKPKAWRPMVPLKQGL